MLWHQRTWTRCHLEPVFSFANLTPRRTGNGHPLNLSFNMKNGRLLRNSGEDSHVNPEVDVSVAPANYFCSQWEEVETRRPSS